MNISDLIDDLNQIISEHGNLPVALKVWYPAADTWYYEPGGELVTKVTDLVARDNRGHEVGIGRTLVIHLD